MITKKFVKHFVKKKKKIQYGKRKRENERMKNYRWINRKEKEHAA